LSIFAELIFLKKKLIKRQQVKYKERTDETLLIKTFTQTFGLARFPNNAYESMKLTKGDVSQCPVFNFKKILKKAINEKF
jgi:hypothetical protein